MRKPTAAARKASTRHNRERPAGIGEMLRAWRKRTKLSQAMAANSLGVSPRTLQNWEQGHREPRGFAADHLREKIK